MKRTVAVAALFGLMNAALGSPVQWSGNNHWYEIVDTSGITWDDAKTAAEARIYNGEPGFLVTITSQGEQDFLETSLLSTLPDGPWGGWTLGFQLPSSIEPDQGWTWNNGESFVYTHWRVGEPNNQVENENRIAIEFTKTSDPVDAVWNDRRNDTLVGSYIVEYLPEPSTATLLAIAGIGLLMRRHGRR